MFSILMTYFKPDEIDKILCESNFIKTNKKIEYLNLSCAFDIESTSFYRSLENEEITTTTKQTNIDKWEKQATMYAWVFGINGKCIIGRTWAEFQTILYKVKEYYHLDENRRIIVYIHNLAFEFQFMRKLFNWLKVFSVEERKPVQCVTTEGIEFRCSYLLSGYNLENVGKNLHKYKVNKMVGDLDYTLARHSKTPLSDKEYKYILNDCLVVMAYIQECIEQENEDITKLPLTKTGYVRRYVRNCCLYEGSHKHNITKYKKYHNLMLSIPINSANEYKQLKRAFHGGFTHASCYYSGETIENVKSFDFTSSYPAVIISEQYPMSKGKLVTLESKQDFIEYLKKYCCLFDITFYELESTEDYEHPLSASKCKIEGKRLIDNGRLESCDKATTTITEQDFFIFLKFYKWKKIEIKNFRIYKKGYLPTDFVKAVLKLYWDKTTLKDVKGEEVNYLKSKEQLNSCFGMCVTDILRNDIVYNCNNDEWEKETQQDINKILQKYNLSKNRFICYQWGVWITAYAMRNLFTGIYECKYDYLYADTDSIKIRNYEKHLDYIKKYNENVKIKMYKALDHHGLSHDLIQPKTIKGKLKPLGVWDDDGFYKRFKTLGAKRYMVETDDYIKITIAGVNKGNGASFLCNGWNYTIKDKKEHKSPFKKFNDNLVIPDDSTGKNIHTYIDYEQQGILTDYLGNKANYYEESSTHLEKTSYSLSLSDEYIDYLIGIKTKKER